MHPIDITNIPTAEISKEKIRLVKRNEREKDRLREINDAFDDLRKFLPVPTKDGKLTKIETLRLAINYINTLQQTLENNEQPTPVNFVHTLSNGLSQTTTNMLGTMFRMKPIQHLPPSQGDLSFLDSHLDQLHPTSQQSSYSNSPTTYSSWSPPQYYYFPKSSTAPRQVSTELAQYHQVYPINAYY